MFPGAFQDLRRNSSQRCNLQTVTLTGGAFPDRMKEHDAIAMFGTNSRTILVDYDDDVAFGSPTAVEALDTTAFGGSSLKLSSPLSHIPTNFSKVI